MVIAKKDVEKPSNNKITAVCLVVMSVSLLVPILEVKIDLRLDRQKNACLLMLM